jgi:zinc transport system substrate-binding protein
MIPPGASPETYEPSPKEMEQFARAGIYFTIGVPSEEANILPFAKEINDMKIISLDKKVAQSYPSIEISPGHTDPHIWLSPKRVKVMIEAIAEEIITLDPSNKQQYLSNAESYMDELESLDRDIKETLKNLKNKKFIVFHPAFAYLADDYGLQMYALEQEGKEATPQQLAEIIDLAKRENIKIIFYQSEISSRQAEAFAEEIGGNAVQLEPLSPDYINNLKQMVQLIAGETQ